MHSCKQNVRSRGQRGPRRRHGVGGGDRGGNGEGRRQGREGGGGGGDCKGDAVDKKEFNPHGGPLPMLECDKSTTSLSFRYTYIPVSFIVHSCMGFMNEYSCDSFHGGGGGGGWGGGGLRQRTFNDTREKAAFQMIMYIIPLVCAHTYSNIQE
jgi:hypothetical protein